MLLELMCPCVNSNGYVRSCVRISGWSLWSKECSWKFLFSLPNEGLLVGKEKFGIMFWGWNFEIEIWNLKFEIWNWNCLLSFPFFGMLILKIEIALCMNDFLCSSIFTDIPFSLLCLFFSLCYSLCLLPFSWDVFCFRMLLSSWGQCMHHVQDPFGLCWSRCWVECWIGHGCDWSYQWRWIV